MVSGRVKIDEAAINVKIRNISLSKVDHIFFLGVVIDDKLTWKPHLQHLYN